MPVPFATGNHDVATHAKCAWARRGFSLTAAQARGLAVLHWNRIASGATAFLNRQKVGENQPTGPYQMLVAAKIPKPGDNEIALEVRGAASVLSCRRGNELLPASCFDREFRFCLTLWHRL